jgi:Protein of unknown function (DUF2905)
MAEFGKILAILAATFLVVGVILIGLSRTGLPIGRLPGDISYRGKNITVYFPLATSLLLSAVLCVVLYLINHFRR